MSNSNGALKMRGNYQLNPGADPTRASEQGFTHEDLVAHTNNLGAFTGAQRNRIPRL